MSPVVAGVLVATAVAADGTAVATLVTVGVAGLGEGMSVTVGWRVTMGRRVTVGASVAVGPGVGVASCVAVGGGVLDGAGVSACLPPQDTNSKARTVQVIHLFFIVFPPC